MVCTGLFSDRHGERERERERERQRTRDRSRERKAEIHKQTDRSRRARRTLNRSAALVREVEKTAANLLLLVARRNFLGRKKRDITLKSKREGETERDRETNEIDRRSAGFDFFLKLVLFFVYPDGMPQTPSCIVVCLFVRFLFFFSPPLP